MSTVRESTTVANFPIGIAVINDEQVITYLWIGHCFPFLLGFYRAE